jgi:hypothetical protein
VLDEVLPHDIIEQHGSHNSRSSDVSAVEETPGNLLAACFASA